MIRRLLVVFLVLLGAARVCDAAFFQGQTFKTSGAVPVNTVAPVISPTTGAVGTLITSTNGTWTGSPTFTYQWEYFDTTTNISGATSSSYTPVSGDIGHTIALLVTGTNAFGNATATSNVTSTVAAPSGCASGPLDANAASPGAWTVAYSLRVARAAFASGGGKAVQLQRSSDSTTQDIGFSGCNPDVTSSTAFCATASLTVGTTSSTRVAFPTGSVIHVLNQGPSGIFYAAGNGSVTASTASTALPPNQGVNITVGANTNLAAIIGTGYGLNGTAGSATLQLTNCGASKIYDQTTNASDAAQTTLADQLGYFPSCGQGGYSCLVGCLSGCNLHAADSATYKTTTVETFTVMTFGEDVTTSNFNYASVGYPNTGTSNASDFRWGLINTADPDIMIPIVNSNTGTNTPEGFGGLWRGQNLTQYDYNASSSNISIRWNGGTAFFNTASGVTPTYPNAVGLYIMGDAAGDGTPGMFVEGLVASGTQTARNSISANQVSFWSITTGVASSIALTNPLSDGWNFAAQQLGGFAPSPPGPGNLTINGNGYATEASWNSYSSWQATNGTTASGQLGDMFRFQMTGVFDQWDGTNRSEVDGSGGGAQFAYGVTFWVAYAVWVEPGTAYNSQWNINGQMHQVEGTVICCIFNTMSNTNSGATDVWQSFTYNAAGSQTSATSTFAFSRGRWYHFVYQVLAATAATGGDTFNEWLDTTTPGVMVQIASNTGATLFGGNAVNKHNYWKYGVYRQTGVPLPTFAIRYGNMQVCSSGADCTAKYGVTDLSALETTPLADPAHLFLLKRDLDPASNDNTPMWLNKAA